MAKSDIEKLVDYGIKNSLIEEDDRFFCLNRILEILGYSSPASIISGATELNEILESLTGDAVERGICDDDTVSRDLFDTALMGALTPMPHEVRRKFYELFSLSPSAATDWYYKFSRSTNYIRTDRIKKDMHWLYPGKYGELEISINLSKPEKDPKAIAAAKNAPQTGYPKCQLCIENEGYAGRINHPARQNHRLVPMTLNNEQFYLQYSPYVYYNEHCIVLNEKHVPMKVDEASIRKLLDFITLFPHYMLGSNADLPIVGGSILSHDHFQGGRHEFPMAKAGIKAAVSFSGFEDVKSGIVDWPMSVIRISSPDRERLTRLAVKILNHWRGYKDEDSFIYPETDGEMHSTVTPIARRRGESYELDMVLRNNITTDEYPLGVFHPHASLHHIKKENIGLIEVMGLAILPGRLKNELDGLKYAILNGSDIRSDTNLAKHADWVDELLEKYTFTEENTIGILKYEIGSVFEKVLEDAGVFKNTSVGNAAFMRFIDSVNRLQ